jgi:hypothetical protein
MDKRSLVPMGLAALVPISVATADGYPHDFQNPVGDSAIFHVSGPATEPHSSDRDTLGDAIVNMVEYPSGDSYLFYYTPSDVSDIQYTGDPSMWLVNAGANTSVGLSGVYLLGSFDGSPDDVSADDLAAFRTSMLSALQNRNLNNLVDLRSSASRFSFIVKFDVTVRDNDPGPDDFGEILYLERGNGSGNSWLKMQAVDEDGNALGPWLAIGPAETTATNPVSYIYDGSGDLAPDFKIMAVMTNEEQPSKTFAFDY